MSQRRVFGKVKTVDLFAILDGKAYANQPNEKITDRKLNIKRPFSDSYGKHARDGLTGYETYIGTMNTNSKDIIIREVSEVGFSPYVIFRDEIKAEYNHIFSLYYDNTEEAKFWEIFDKYFDRKGFIEKSYWTYTSDERKTRDKYIYSIEKQIYFSIGFTKDDVSVLCLAVKHDEALTKFIEELETLRVKKTDSQLHIICHNGRNFYLESFDMPKPTYTTFDFFDCYNEEFEKIATTIKERLAVKNGKGIVLFHGGFGTGKTTFMRHLMTAELGKKVIYMPPDLAYRIASPEFVTFLMENPNSILIIEDAENILKAREAGGDQAVSNLLNVSDGILGDVLHLQIVCTFNCAREHLDQALLRPGRLIAEYKFDNLSKEKATKLMQKHFNNEELVAAQDMSLAEVFNVEVEQIKTKDTKRKFGFV